MAQPPIPERVESLDAIPPRLRLAYDLSVLGWYEPNIVGATIGAYRAALAKEPHREPLAPRRKLSRREWALLLSIAEQDERAHFLRAKVSKRITLID